MLTLNSTETKYYQTVLKTRALNLPAGVSFKISSLFRNDPVSPRLCRRFFEEVLAGLYPNIAAAGKKSRDGYTVL